MTDVQRLYYLVSIGWSVLWVVLEGAGAIIAVPVVAACLGISLVVAHGKRRFRLGMTRPLQRLTFTLFSFLLSTLTLFIGIDGSGGPVGNSTAGLVVIVGLVLATAASFLLDLFQELRKPPEDIPDAWR